MTTDLREELTALADTHTFSPDPAVWERGRRVRRRDRSVRVAVAAAVVAAVAGMGTLTLTGDGDAGVAGTEVAAGAIPSRIDDVPSVEPTESDLAIGRASVAFISSAGQAVVIGATDGRRHVLDLPVGVGQPLALSPDGRRLAWAAEARLHIADLESGEVLDVAHDQGNGSYVRTLWWQVDSVHLEWRTTGEDGRGTLGGTIDVTGPSEGLVPAGRPEAQGIASPSRDIVAMPTDDLVNGLVEEAPFLREGSGPGGGAGSERVDRRLPADLYPDGAVVRPLGWASENLVLAVMSAPPGSYVEGDHLVLFTSPDRPESEWTYRILARDVPGTPNLTVAVDLVPDLDGTSSQELTHDFGADQERDISWLIGLDVAAAIAVLMALRLLWRRVRS